LILLLGVGIGLGVALFVHRGDGAPESGGDVSSAYARALAFYRNETNAKDRRARMELSPFYRAYGNNPAWLLDMALIDLAEINHPVQAEDHLLGEPTSHVLLLQSALRRLETARTQAPSDDAIAFNLARTLKRLAPNLDDPEPFLEAAKKLLKPLAERDDSDAAALIQYAELLHRYSEPDWQAAFDAYDRVVKRGKDFVPQTQFRISEWRRATCLQRLDRDKGAAEFDRLARAYDDPPNAKADALERGAYTKLRPIDPVPTPDPEAHSEDDVWRRVTERTLLPSLGTPRFFIAPDIDGDCARDAVLNSEGGLRVMRNRRNATFADMTQAAGLPLDFVCAAAAVADVNEDGLTDLVIGGPSGVRLYLNRTDPEAPSRWLFEAHEFKLDSPATALVFWDMDHDGDLDLFVGGPDHFYRGVVEETADTSIFRLVKADIGIEGTGTTDAILIDVEDDDDVDLLLARPGGNVWLENLRQMQFRSHSMPAGTHFDVGDLDGDFVEDIRVGGVAYKFVNGEFQSLGKRGPLLDLNGDGFIDAKPLEMIAYEGVVERAIASDLNRDGARDLILVTDGGLNVFLSRPFSPKAWIDVRPRGGATNAMGIGTKVRVYAGDLTIGATCRDGLVAFGIGQRTLIDCILLRWTNGVEQGVVLPNVLQCLPIEEREGEVGSCPFVYTYDGERWHFIADVQSGLPLGLPYADRKYLPTRTNETILIPGSALKPVDGKLRVDITEEFRELFYADQVVLRAIDHPRDVRPVLNEGFTVRKFPEFRVHGLRDLRPATKATDQLGRDWTEQLSQRDQRHAVVFEKLASKQYEGLAKPWSIELDFGDVPATERLLLVMDGWVEFPTASASIAASQSKTVHFQMPVLDYKAADGTWKRAHDDPGFPAGKLKSVLVDLTGKVPPGPLKLRLSSTQRLHWDSFFLSTGPDEQITLTQTPMLSAVAGFHGVGVRIEDPSGELPWRYSHDDLETFYRWDQMPRGMLSRYGDVKELLAEIDDRYPILASGDRVRLEFDGSALPPLPEGWVRDWCLTTEGWVKDADMNQAVRETVGPLPFHAMSIYPYDEAKEQHPHPDWIAEWLTRPARRLVNPEALGARLQTGAETRGGAGGS